MLDGVKQQGGITGQLFYPLPTWVLRRLPEPPPAAGLGREPDTASQSSPHSSASSIVSAMISGFPVTQETRRFCDLVRSNRCPWHEDLGGVLLDEAEADLLEVGAGVEVRQLQRRLD
jgi:hypothetical protein